MENNRGTQAQRSVMEWPKIRVERHNPLMNTLEIVSLQEAAKRFGLDDRQVGWLERGEVAGVMPNKETREIRMLHRYTPLDSTRDAASDLLRAAEWALWGLEQENMGEKDYAHALRNAIAKACGSRK